MDLMIVGTRYQDLAKLIAARVHDLDDVRQILAAGVDLDAAYVEEWAVRWDVLDRWRAILAEDRSTW